MSEAGGRYSVCAAQRIRLTQRVSPAGETEVEPNMASKLSRFKRWAKLWGKGKTPYRRTEITVETEQVLIIRRRGSKRAWCHECGHEVDMVGLADAEALTGMTGPDLRAYAEARGWHVFMGEDGSDLICLESWLKSA